MRYRPVGSLQIVFALTALTLIAVRGAKAQGIATYDVTFTATWSAATHPHDFPSSPHFSGLIGATHHTGVYFWATDELASPGIRTMAELGGKAALTSEVNQAIQAGTAGEVLDGAGISPSPGARKMTFRMDPFYPLVTLVSMIAPSPDWFVGVRGLSLLYDRRWVDTLTVDLFVYDAGTDSGPTYTSPNSVTNPPEPIARIETAPFRVNGVVTPVGTFTFVLQRIEIGRAGFYQTAGTQIVDGQGTPVVMKGIGLGGWLMPEGYMLHISTPGTDGPTGLRNQMIDLIGERDTDEFWTLFRDLYVQEKDIAKIKEWGFDHIRLPFHYNLFYDPDIDQFKDEGFLLLDRFLEWCSTHELGVILDMHAAPGAQSEGGIADSDGVARLWTEPDTYWPQTVKIWREIARRYGSEKQIIGYDLINEPVIPTGVETSELRRLYERITAAVRDLDPNHLLFIEGNYWATVFGDLEPAFDDHMVYTFHHYWKGTGQNAIQYLLDLRTRQQKPLYLGETGENSNPWFYALTRLAAEHDIGVNWWTHKKVETTTSPLSTPFAPGYQAVVDYWRNSGPRPPEGEAEQALFDTARNLDLDSARVNVGLLAALFDEDFATARRPFKDHEVPGVINAADYDIGFQGITYSDDDYWATTGAPGGGNNGTKYRNDGVDIESSTDPEGFEYNVGWTNPQEWLTYTATVTAEGVFDIHFRVASSGGGTSSREAADIVIQIEDAGSWSVLGEIEVGDTGGWQNWVTRTVTTPEITAGTHRFRVFFQEGNVNFNRMRFEPSVATSASDLALLPEKPELVSTYPNPFTDQVSVGFTIPAPSSVRVELYDVLGRRVFQLADARYNPGEHVVQLAPDLVPGVYMLRLTLMDDAGQTAFTRPLVATR